MEGMEEAGKRHNAVAEAIRGRIEAQEEQFLQLTAGGCSVCQCAPRWRTSLALVSRKSDFISGSVLHERVRTGRVVQDALH